MAINFRDVDFKYSKKTSYLILNKINLTINNTGEFICIVGHTGSGKTTLVQHMNALLFATNGEVSIDNRIVKNSKSIVLKDIRKKVGLVFQFSEYQLFEETVLKDIMFGPCNFGKSKEEAKVSAIKSAKLLGISDEILEKSPFNLSGGQMRRVAIAGVLASDPDVLILDEPTVGLDPKGKTELMDLLKKIQKETNKTIIMVSHDMNIVAEYAKRIIVINKGEIVYDGNKQVLFNNPDILLKYNLDLPIVAKIALKLKLKGMIEYKYVPLTKDELYDLIIYHGENHE